MKSKELIFLLIITFVYLESKAQLGKFNIGLNARLSFLTNISSDGTTEYVDIYKGTPSKVIFNTPLTFRYTTNSLISLRFQIEYRKENFYLLDRYSDSEFESNCKYLINSLHILFKLNKSEVSNTSISVGMGVFHCFSQNYRYLHYGEQFPGSGRQIDSSYTYSSTTFKHLKNSLFISINRETVFKKTNISLYRELSFSIPAYNHSNNVLVFNSFDIGFMFGLCYNFNPIKSTY